MNSRKPTIKAFTILEVTIVVALLSLLVGVIATTINRFNEQLHHSSAIHKELNDWFAFRSNLWSELYTAEGFAWEEGVLHIQQSSRVVEYRLADTDLQRKTGESDWVSTGMQAEKISLEEADLDKIVRFQFLWKGDPMELSYYYRPDADDRINTYFDHLP